MFHARVSTTDPTYSYQTRHKLKSLLICWEATLTLETLSVMVKDCLGLIRNLIQLVTVNQWNKEYCKRIIFRSQCLWLSFGCRFISWKYFFGGWNGTAGSAFLPVNFSGVSRFGREGELTMLTGRWDIRVKKENLIYCYCWLGIC